MFLCLKHTTLHATTMTNANLNEFNLFLKKRGLNLQNIQENIRQEESNNPKAEVSSPAASVEYGIFTTKFIEKGSVVFIEEEPMVCGKISLI